MKRFPTFFSRLLLLFLIGGFDSALSQQGQEPFRVTAEVALVDLIITDEDGRPVENLTPQDIEIREGGKKRKIVFLQPNRVLRPGQSPEGGPAPGEPHRERPAPFVFVFDLNSLDPQTLLKCKEAVHGFTASSLSSSEVPMLAFVEESLTILRPFSRDTQAFLEALEEIPSTRGILTYNDLLNRFSNITRTNPDPLEESIITARDFIRDVNNREKDLMEGLAGLAEYLRTLPGRKNVVLYTAGYPSNVESTVMEIVMAMPWRVRTLPGDSPRAILSAKLGGALGSPAAETYSQTVQRINSQQMSIYVVDARGLLGPTLHSARETPGLPVHLSSRFRSESSTAPQGFMKALASDTGAMSYLNQNEWTRGAAQALKDTRDYTVIGYLPDKAKSGENRRLEVEARRPGIEIRRRRDFFTSPPAEPDREINNAFQFPALFADFPFTVKTRTAPGLLTVEAIIPTSELLLRNQDGKYQSILGFYGALVRNGKWVGDGFAFARKFPLDLTPEKYEAFRKMATVTTPAEAKVEGGDYELIVVLAQESAGLLSSFRSTVSIPD